MLDDYDSQVWKEIFFKVNFKVDKCLSMYTQKSDLQTLRRELKQYGTELHTCMSEILKTETEAIVYLAENLTNLSSKIDDLSLPFLQLCEEVRGLHDAIKKVQEGFQNHLERMKLSKTELDNLRLHKELISASLYVNDILMINVEDANERLIYLERAVNKFSFQKMYMNEMGLGSNKFDSSETVSRLIEAINKYFLQSLQEGDANTLVRCLRMFVNLDLQNEAENIYRHKVVRPALQSIFSNKNLEHHNQDLNDVYQDALQFLNVEMKLILEILKNSPDLKGFNFVLHSYWYEVDKQLREGLPNVTAPGNPDQFQNRFRQSWEYFKQIALKCNNVNLLKSDKTFQDHIKRFNLAVYFEIRFQQIVTKLEEELLVNTYSYAEAGAEYGFNLKVTQEMWKSIKRCFDRDVYLEHLSYQFLKLSMLIVSRYLTWLDKCVPTLNEKPDMGETFIVHALIDLDIIKNLLARKSNIEDTIYSVFPKIMHHILLDVIKLNHEILEKSQINVRQFLVHIKVQECGEHLSKVDSIPRLYRRTHKSFPKEPSSYIMAALDIVTKFTTQYEKFKNTQSFRITVDLMVSKITTVYLNHVREVLSNVCKTEESLRRLKNRNQPTGEDSSVQSGDKISDEKKIREQIKLDAGHFKNTLTPLSSETSKLDLDKLYAECNF